MNNTNFAPVWRNTLRNQLTVKLRNAILRGHIKQGQPIVEEDLAKKMNISRGPIREALIELEHERLTIRGKNRRTKVVNLSPDDVEEICSLRLALELLAIKYVIPKVQEKDLSGLEKILKQMSFVLHDKKFNLEKLVEIDLKFHECLVNISGHKHLILFWQRLRSQIYFLIFSCDIYSTEHLQETQQTSIATHKRILESIRSKDLDLATKLLTQNLGSDYTDFRLGYKRFNDKMSGKNL